jgi:hypothetical protein
MDNAFQAFLVLIGAAFSLMVCGAALTFGVATVCRWMAWAPVNTTININNYREVADCTVTSHQRGEQ